MYNYHRHLTMISDILNEFKFERVSKTMKCLDWEWFNVGHPTVDQLRNSARERLDAVVKNCLLDGVPEIGYTVSSGGLKATAYKNDYGQITFIELEFILTSWETTDSEL